MLHLSPTPAGELVDDRPVPEEVRPFTRLARTADPTYPFRLTVRLRDEQAVAKVARYLVRVA
ncbi:MAG: hypothetical protein L0323_13220 [Planctomycetes bacterium]|nr:hypothetical protein [Planctomycetota bacterium]